MANAAAVRRFVAAYGTALAGLALFVFLLLMARNFATVANLLNVLKQTSFLAILSVGFTFALITAELDPLLCRPVQPGGGGDRRPHPWGHPLAARRRDGDWRSASPAACQRRPGDPPQGALPDRHARHRGHRQWSRSHDHQGRRVRRTDGMARFSPWPAARLPASRTWSCSWRRSWASAGSSPVIPWWDSHDRHRRRRKEARRAGVATRRMKTIGLTVSGAGRNRRGAAGRQSQLGGAADGWRFPAQRHRRRVARHDHVRAGRPNVAGSFVGALIIAMLANGLVLLGAPYYIQDIMLGVIVIGSVSVSASVLKKAAFSI